MKIKKMLLFLKIGIVLFALTSCIEDPVYPILDYSEGSGLFILNQGSFTYGNSSLSFYDPLKKEVVNNIFYDSNGFPIGDALQSISLMDSLGFLCVSNSGKILVFNTNTFKHIATISGLGSPRYLEIIDKNKAYLSDLYSPSIGIIDLVNYKEIGSIRIGNSSETFARYGDVLFINSWSYNNNIYVVNTVNDELVDSIIVRKQPNSMVLDKNHKLWVLSDGGYEGSPYGQVNAALTRIDADHFKVEKVFEFPDIGNSPAALSINAIKDSLFFINGGWSGEYSIESGIYAMGISDDTLPFETYIPADGRRFYGLAVDAISSSIYCSDALDFMQRGWVYSFSSEGTPVDTFQVGIGPGGFGFK